jgi:putative oxidoreductase
MDFYRPVSDAHLDANDTAGHERLVSTRAEAPPWQPAVAQWTPQVLSVLRIVVAFLFMAHGSQKLFAFPVGQPQSPVDISSLMGAAGLIESVGGLLLLMGLYTRPVAFLLSGEMAVAYFTAHAGKNFWPLLNGGEPAVLYCFLFLFFTAAGAGAWSLDAMLRSPRFLSRTPTTRHHDRWATSH